MPGTDTTVTAAPNTAQPAPVALFVSDVHLHARLPLTTKAFLDFLRTHARKARQLYLLGDLFEYWAGDDDISDPYNAEIIATIREISDAGVAVFWVSGNRDFLIANDFAQAAGAVLLSEPYVTEIGGQRIAMLHGDAQCTDDQAYMAFRKKVRDPQWQRDFLKIPLAQRKAIIDGMRAGSREAQRDKSYEIMDVNEAAIADVFARTGSTLMIHGHTHRPAAHEYMLDDRKAIRHVLPDWDCDRQPARGGWIGIDATGAVRRYGIDGLERMV